MEQQIETEEQLRAFLGLSKGELINTNNGALDIFSVKSGKVSYGFLADGSVMKEDIDSFLNHFPVAFGKNSKKCKFKYQYNDKIICDKPGSADYLDYDLCNEETCKLLK